MVKQTNRILMILIAVLAILFVFPSYWMITGSFNAMTSGQTGIVAPSIWPKVLTLLNYADLFGEFPIGRWMFNGLVVAFAVTAISVSTSCLAGYAFAKKRFLGKNIIFWMIMATLMIPFYSVIIPLFIMIRGLGLFNTYPGIFLPLSCSAINVFLARQYMSTLPSELIDASKIDGASEVKIFFSVIMPLCKPLVAALAIFTFVYSWKAFMWPLVVTASKGMRTLPVAIAICVSYPEGYVEFGMSMAGATLVALPTYLVFAFFQKYFVGGITMGGLKG